MEYGLAALAAQIVVLYVFSKLIIYIDLRYHRDKSDDFIVVNVYLGKKFMLYSMKVPVVELIKNDESLWLSSEIKTSDGTAKTKTNIERERRFLNNIVRMYFYNPRRLWHAFKSVKFYAKLYRRVICRLVNSLNCERLYWKTTYGSDDAAITGLMSGTLWTVKGMLVTVLRRRFCFSAPPELSVTPAFGQACFYVDFQCIFSLRLGKVISAATILTNLSGKGAATGGRASNPRANEDSYGKYKRYG
ncbi:MAG: DUF2953 domain-containing protein [Veillonellaceae bacterium]|jgi:hypothetical protein|nr:DUF2953 domain-containing protein [Veillonellaceae bacterium]